MSNKQALIDGLNSDLSAEWGTIMRYTYQAAHSFGIGGSELREILSEEINDELRHATFLTDVIVDLGGEPTTEPQEFNKAKDTKAMLEQDLEMERQDVKNYKQHAEMAEELGEMELKVKLEEMAADEDRHAREIRRLLKGIE